MDFNVCMRNCGGQAGCLETCSRGRSGWLRRCGQSENFTHVPFRRRDCVLREGYYWVHAVTTNSCLRLERLNSLFYDL